MRTGLQLEGTTYHSDDSSNYLGTYTFESLDAFRAGTPRSYTRRTGDPNIDYRNMQAGIYLQDDIRVRKNLTFSPGVRYELQTHLSDVQQLRTALRRHLVAGQERQDDPARQRGHLLRLAVDRHLRADAARGRLPAARDEHHQSAVPVSRAGGPRLTDEPLPARRRPADAALHAAERGLRPGGDEGAARQRALRAHERRQPAARPEPQRADRRATPGSDLQQRRRSAGRCGVPAEHVECRLHLELQHGDARDRRCSTEAVAWS